VGFDCWYEMLMLELADRALEASDRIDEVERPCRVAEEEDGPVA